MAIKTLKMSELRGLSQADFNSRVEEFAKHHDLNGEAALLDQRIAEFESRYEMSSCKMLESFHSGGLRETADIGRWIMLLSIRDDIAKHSSQTRS